MADETKLLKKITSWDEPYRSTGERLHQIVTEAAPQLRPKLFYGAPGYALDGPVLIHFRLDDGHLSFGITEKADLRLPDDAADLLLESAWFVTGLDDATEARLTGIVQRVVGA